jgi:hypothetical protein
MEHRTRGIGFAATTPSPTTSDNVADVGPIPAFRPNEAPITENASFGCVEGRTPAASSRRIAARGIG